LKVKKEAPSKMMDQGLAALLLEVRWLLYCKGMVGRRAKAGVFDTRLKGCWAKEGSQRLPTPRRAVATTGFRVHIHTL